MRKKKTRSDSGGLSGKIERESRSGTGFKITASRWLPWAWAVRSGFRGHEQGGGVGILLVTQRDQKPLMTRACCVLSPELALRNSLEFSQHPHFTDGETEAWGSSVTWPASGCLTVRLLEALPPGTSSGSPMQPHLLSQPPQTTQLRCTSLSLLDVLASWLPNQTSSCV